MAMVLGQMTPKTPIEECEALRERRLPGTYIHVSLVIGAGTKSPVY